MPENAPARASAHRGRRVHPEARNGWLIVDKPVGPSSNAAVQKVRHTLGIGGRRGMKAGHAGTLDPFASGLLIVLLGKATRLMPHVVGHDKRYRVDVRFGGSSSTDDVEGELARDARPAPSRAAVEHALAALAATTEQVPPAVSALHIDGVRAYRRVRRGETVEVPPRPVRFEFIRLVEWREPEEGLWGPRAVLDVRCGTGTYMRALARDLGQLVGQHAHCEALRRTEVGSFTLDRSHAPDAVEWSDVRDAASLLDDDVPRLTVDDAAIELVGLGARLPFPSDRPDLAGVPHLALVDRDGAFISMAEPNPDASLLQPRSVFVDPPPARVE